MVRHAFILCATVAMALPPSVAQAQFACELCDSFGAASAAGSQGKGAGQESKAPGNGATPVSIEMASDIAFGRLALQAPASASARIDHRTGQVRVDYNLRDLGGLKFQGRARITGEPFRAVRVEMPASVVLRAAGGSKAELTEFASDLPVQPTLDASGQLEFSFGGRLRLEGGGGNYRGRVQIHVRYD